jgi:hypothetical protein
MALPSASVFADSSETGLWQAEQSVIVELVIERVVGVEDAGCTAIEASLAANTKFLSGGS